jgi:hypothetical protein
MFEKFYILSGEVYFSHNQDDGDADWILEQEKPMLGTTVGMEIANNSIFNSTAIFDRFSEGDDYAFSKTVVPVKLTKFGDDQLVSRSQAKRLLMRFDRFKTIVLDFDGVDSIGQAFADEVFRVFKNNYPNINLVEINTCEAVKKMISRARAEQTSSP